MSSLITKVTSQHSGETLEQVVDQEIEIFEAWFRELGNEPIVRSERAILKTYLWWKTHPGETPRG
jgi:hypothetical protein